VANTVGFANTASGYEALSANISGNDNTAYGYGALNSSTNDNDNTAIGVAALYSSTNGSDNTAIGADAMFEGGTNYSGSYSTAVGSQALFNGGNNDTAVGYHALAYGGNNNTTVGSHAGEFATGSNNITFGYQAGANIITGSYNIEIGNAGTAADNNTILIGTQGTQTNTMIAGIYGNTAASGVPVYVTSTGTLGTLTSSARFKDDIRSMDDASDVLLSLRPVTFHYKAGIDPKATPQFGLVAEEVDQVDPDLVLRDAKHEIYTVRYEAVNAMLLNEFLKQHRKVEEQDRKVAAQSEKIQDQVTEIETLKEKSAKVDVLEQQLNELKQVVQSLAGKN
jgi:hypothetical protein